MNLEQLIDNLNISKEKIKYNEPMAKHTSFKIGGPAQCFINAESVEEIKQICKVVSKNDINLTIIGNGSNLLVTDNGINGIVVKVNIKKFELEFSNDDVSLIVGAGNKLGEIAQKLLRNEITGFEFAAGIPGTIGGAVRMNAGAYGKEMKDIVETVKYMDYDGNIYEKSNKDLEFEYRKSMFAKNKFIILEAKLKLQKGNAQYIKDKMLEFEQSRKQKQPLEFPSAGSTFKRGTDFITAKLIDDAGLKGYRVGGAMVSTKHAGFVVNENNATAQDVLNLVKHIKQEVYKKFNKKIELEIQVIGEES
ncbi:uDP-N-acetylenolpyruvoylglucosamine reductase [Clostridium sp. CAG:440]|nr:uDP-N-acetylenolpyruvoylglucosamine reductase [Clostridium sp. CAG:440]